ncbi:DnaJ C-terminal domain-containing protein [Noviherbaspirillum galbum]|uniref:DnaJ domain-containing protein n=1 Tax=Noviherbaspirillum galbum TaxID=2709383 RepID=A0A6B3SJ80_9BURK|nr:DnaJ C-terminal domain-containing protein [Noviherbaspirillum galbum]NEX60760.1 DnaJ domain-containing protein [Noviherbaspirillum galbum]
METRDYYEMLGVARDASADDIKKAFRRLARKYHPDVSKEPDAELKMKEINEAFGVLSDPEKRAAYDEAGRRPDMGAGFGFPPGWEEQGWQEHAGRRRAAAGSDEDAFGDLFSELFGGGGPFRQSGRTGASFDMPGEDQHAEIGLDLEDAYTGATRTITLRMPSGDRSLQVRIPRGVRPGQSIRLAGQGAPGIGGKPGDLYLKVHFKPHPRYRAEGRNLFASLPVAPWEAALGATVDATLPDGKVEVRIPPGTQPGRKLRLKGRGIPAGAQGDPGDAYLVVEVRLPPADSPRARELYEAMARDLNFDPRGASVD